MKAGFRNGLQNTDTVPTLCARDYKGIGNADMGVIIEEYDKKP